MKKEKITWERSEDKTRAVTYVSYIRKGGTTLTSGMIRFLNGICSSAHPPPTYRHCPRPYNSEIMIRKKGEQGIPLHENEDNLINKKSAEVLRVLTDHSLTALSFLEALHSGDISYFRNMTEALRARKSEVHDNTLISQLQKNGADCPIESEEVMKALSRRENRRSRIEINTETLLTSIRVAATECGKPPRVDEVARVYDSLSVFKYPELKNLDHTLSQEVHSGDKLPRRDGKFRIERLKKALDEIGFDWLPIRSSDEVLND